MKNETYVATAYQRTLVLAAVAVWASISIVHAQMPASPANKAAAPAPTANQPMPMEKKDAPTSAMPGMAQGSGDMRSSMAGMMKSMESMKMTGDTDRDFAAMMKMHHQGAIDMAQQELKSGKDAKMRAMAKRIIDAQQKEIKEFDQWLERHK